MMIFCYIASYIDL